MLRACLKRSILNHYIYPSAPCKPVERLMKNVIHS